LTHTDRFAIFMDLSK